MTRLLCSTLCAKHAPYSTFHTYYPLTLQECGAFMLVLAGGSLFKCWFNIPNLKFMNLYPAGARRTYAGAVGGSLFRALA